ncbi:MULTISPECIES: hypothetical protein [unclassified Kitasatospora]|uniref:hypothetical protein n=1 Tax=unclassified Kitasatospora TaxID=2633591 RepID=UPI0033D0C8B9
MHQRCRMPAHASTAVTTADSAVSTTAPARIQAVPADFTAVLATLEAGRAFS